MARWCWPFSSSFRLLAGSCLFPSSLSAQDEKAIDENEPGEGIFDQLKKIKLGPVFVNSGGQSSSIQVHELLQFEAVDRVLRTGPTHAIGFDLGNLPPRRTDDENRLTAEPFVCTGLLQYEEQEEKGELQEEEGLPGGFEGVAAPPAPVG